MQFFSERQLKFSSWSKLGYLGKSQDLDGLLIKNCRYINTTPTPQIQEVLFGKYLRNGYHISVCVTDPHIGKALRNLLSSVGLNTSSLININDTNIIKINTPHFNDLCYFFSAMQQVEAAVLEFEFDLAKELGLNNLIPLEATASPIPSHLTILRQITKLSLHGAETETSTDHSEPDFDDPDLSAPFIMD